MKDVFTKKEAPLEKIALTIMGTCCVVVFVCFSFVAVKMAVLYLIS